MKLKILTALLAVGMLASCGKKAGEADKSLEKPTSYEDKVSYAIGLNTGKTMRRDSLKIQTNYYLRGLQDGLDSANFLLTDAEVEKTMTEFQSKMQAKQNEIMNAQIDKLKKLGEEMKAIGPKFLEENKKKAGVKTTPSGLQYEVLAAGSGDAPGKSDAIRMHYKASFPNGQVFDQTYDKNQPINLPAQGFFPGWAEAAKYMQKGGKYRFVFPANLAFGDKGAGQIIPPNATLIFEIEVLDIMKGGAVPPAGPQAAQPVQPTRR
ncbi:MAG: FKBP-type peptidyl-prolyl cis-trans isomerase N-terminal domain-containing protein [Chloroflexota bacterium]